jgi:hypothetical protein
MRKKFSESKFGRVVFALLGILAAALLSGRPAQSRQNAKDARAEEQAKKGSEVTGFYCNLKALSLEERFRHYELTTRLAGARRETKELADGYAFRLSEESVSLADVAEWVVAERKCCPFFNFEIEAKGDAGPVWLTLRGQDGVKAFTQAEIGVGH